MKIISLGWGVQSMTLAVMAALGDIEPIDYAIHSDTTHERTDTYIYAEKYTKWMEDRGVKVVTVNDKSAADGVWEGKFIPVIADNGIDEPGRALRTCTQR